MIRLSARSRILNNILRLSALGAITSAALIAPNAIQLFDKPVQNLLKRLDEKERKTELEYLLRYAKSHKLISENYEHGLIVSEKALKRIEEASIAELEITAPDAWDHRWRIVFFDIPEAKKSQRDAFAQRLKNLGFRVLQRSIFIHPYPCRNEIVTLCE